MAVIEYINTLISDTLDHLALLFVRSGTCRILSAVLLLRNCSSGSSAGVEDQIVQHIGRDG
jgi:hypothetical protein